MLVGAMAHFKSRISVALVSWSKRRSLRAATVLVALAFRSATAQQLGYKLLGSAGIDAGVQPPAGLAIVEQTLHYHATQVRNRDGDVVPIDGLTMNATGSALGVSYTSKRRSTPYLTFALGLPIASIHVSSDNPAASLNGFGFSDVFVQPIKVGWRERRFDVVTAYVVYVPSGHYEPLGNANVGRGYWTHQLSIGGALFADSTRRQRMSALVSYEQNTRKRGIDIRRGNMLQVQGGAGANVLPVVVVGLAGYALWQVSPDRGADIPPVLRNERTRAFGLGPELGIAIPRWTTQVTLRVEGELGVRSRPDGVAIAVNVAYLVRHLTAPSRAAGAAPRTTRSPRSSTG